MKNAVKSFFIQVVLPKCGGQKVEMYSIADVVELVDTQAWGACAVWCVGSSPIVGTILNFI